MTVASYTDLLLNKDDTGKLVSPKAKQLALGRSSTVRALFAFGEYTMNDLNDFRSKLRNIGIGAISHDAIDEFAMTLTAAMIEADPVLLDLFGDATTSPIHTETKYDFRHLTACIADHTRPLYGHGSTEDVRAIGEKCFALAIELTRGAA